MAPDHSDDDLRQDDPDRDDTVVRGPVAIARPVDRLAGGPDLDDTVLGADRPAAPRVPVATVPAPTKPAPAAPPPVAPRVRMPDGAVVEIEAGTVYVGRRPSLPRVPASGVPQLVTVPSARREVSSTHLAISAVGGAVVVRDMLSTNGTVVKMPGVAARTLLRGESAVVTVGTVLDLGDGNLIEVLR